MKSRVAKKLAESLRIVARSRQPDPRRVNFTEASSVSGLSHSRKRGWLATLKKGSGAEGRRWLLENCDDARERRKGPRDAAGSGVLKWRNNKKEVRRAAPLRFAPDEEEVTG